MISIQENKKTSFSVGAGEEGEGVGGREDIVIGEGNDAAVTFFGVDGGALYK